MDFADDTLGGVLSDGSNDSFFDEPKPAAKRSSLTKTPEKKSITDIFNIGDQTPKKSDDWLGLDSKESKSPSRAQKLTKKISFDDDEDVLGTLGLTKRPQTKSDAAAEEKPSKKMDLLESILGPSKSEEVKKPTLDDILKESKVKSATTTPVTSKSGILPATTDALSISEPREGRRGRRSSAGLMDPLGLFSTEQKEVDSPVIKEKTAAPNVESVLSRPGHSKSTPNISDQGLPDWLAGVAPIKPSKSESVLTQKAEEVTIPEPPQKPIEVTAPVINQDNQSTLNSILTQQKLSQSHMEYQNTAIALQQQESQILVALQLKKYEENLSEMQMKQQEVLMKQEQQFNLLLERQFAKQQIMENNMRLQQERINNHIQMLISQPPVTKYPNQEEFDELKKTASDESVKLYENIISSLKQRQHEEMFLIEESYKKQISLLEQSLEIVEKRLKTDVEKISETCEEKLKELQQQHNEDIEKYKQKIKDMDSQHAEEIKQIREYNARIIDEIKFEHATLLENIKETKKAESSMVQESNSYFHKLDSNIEILYSNSKSLVELRDHIEKDYGVLSRAREESLKAKEQEIALMKNTLEKCREAAEKERTELLALVRTLETKIAEQNQNTREERWTFQQAASTLAARSAAMDREAEFNRAAIEREREQLKTMKESILAEQEKMLLQLTEEKLSLSVEKSRLETSSKLMMNYDSQKAKAEMEAAIQIAKEAAAMTDKERENLHREKCEVEILKRALLDQERKLNLREKEIANLMREAESMKNDGERAIFESKTIENKYNERLRDLQNQLVTLANREKKLAEEKIILSKERLALNTMMRQNKKCSLCSADPQKLDENNFISNSNNLITPYFSRFDSVDNDIMRLRLETIEDPPLNVKENVSM